MVMRFYPPETFPQMFAPDTNVKIFLLIVSFKHKTR
jgi:hypothetical protein